MIRSKILVVPAGTEIGLEIRESLALSKHWSLIAANSLRDHSEVTFERAFFDLPFAGTPDFVPAVRRIAEAEDVDFVVPCHDEASFALAGESLGRAKIVGPNRSVAAILRFKSRTYDALKDRVKCPRVYDAGSLDGASFPIFAKPDRGQGSRGARKVTARHDLSEADVTGGELIFTEYLPGREYTIDCFTDQAGRLLYVGPRIRTRINNGISARTEEVVDQRLNAMASEISDALPLRGAWFFQARDDADGVPTLLEVANRVSGTMGFQRERGVNLIEAWLHNLCGREIAFSTWTGGAMKFDRALAARVAWDYRPDAVYVDLDDTLVLPGGALNYRLVGNLFGLKFNLGARMVLITRHGQDVGTTLSGIGLAGLFDDVHHLVAGEPKSSVIVEGPAILIDDSFAERHEVARARGIPTFPLEAMACIEGLNHAALNRDDR